MKILIVSARYYPEPFTIVRIAEKLVEIGNDVTVLTGKPNYGKWKTYDGYENVSSETINGVKIIRVNEKPRKRGFFGLLVNYLNILKLYKSGLRRNNGDYDVVLGHVLSPIFSISYLRFFCKKHQIPSVLYGFDLWPESLVASGYFNKSSIVIKIMKVYCRKIYNGFDFITFASPSAKQYFTNYLKVDKPFKHIYQPCLTSLPCLKLISNHKYRRDGKIHILFCGTIAKFNHLNLFIKALDDELLRKNIVFDIVGSGSDYDSVYKEIKEHNLQDVVHMYGRVSISETVEFYKNADILFVPLFYNSATSLMIPQKLIEYLMYGRPILGMIKGDGEDLITSASNLNIIADQNVDSLRMSMFRLLSMTDNDMANCGMENRLFYESNPRFTLDCVAGEINDILIKVIQDKAKW